MMGNPPPPLPRSPRPPGDPLATIAYGCVIFATFGYGLFSFIWPAINGTRLGKLEESSYTNAQAAYLTLTNLNDFPVETCVVAVVAKKIGRDEVPVRSVPVCTGKMLPHTTVKLEAPYRIDAVRALCGGEPDRFGNVVVDWGKCTFDTQWVWGSSTDPPKTP